jgi:hypothetical protein
LTRASYANSAAAVNCLATTAPRKAARKTGTSGFFRAGPASDCCCQQGSNALRHRTAIKGL